jgi:hypothetical protein
MKKININGTNHTIEADAENISYGNSNVKTTLDALVEGSDNIDVSQRGYFGANYPDQMRKIIELDKKKSCLRFIQVTDTHYGGVNDYHSLGSAGLLNNSEADFFVHTGDFEQSNFWGAFAWPDAFDDEEKPCLIVLGNHDCDGSTFTDSSGSAGDKTHAQALAARYSKFFQPLLNNARIDETEIDDGKTYYHLDFEKDSFKYRCLFLDLCDGGISAADNNPTNWSIYTVMTDEQKVWMIEQLQDAAQRGHHVLIFCHIKPDDIGGKASGWFTTLASDGQNCNAVRQFLLDVVNAFMTGGTYTLNGTEYDFDMNGIFVGWFCGHSHNDEYGWSVTYPQQFLNVSTKIDTGTNNSFDQNYSDLAGGQQHFKYICVDADERKVTLYHCGGQNLKNGGKRTIFTYNYE